MTLSSKREEKKVVSPPRWESTGKLAKCLPNYFMYWSMERTHPPTHPGLYYGCWRRGNDFIHDVIKASHPVRPMWSACFTAPPLRSRPIRGRAWGRLCISVALVAPPRLWQSGEKRRPSPAEETHTHVLLENREGCSSPGPPVPKNHTQYYTHESKGWIREDE